MQVARSCSLAAAGLALRLATPVGWAHSRRFDGAWWAEFSGNQFCYAPHYVTRFTIRNGVIMTARGHRGNVDANGRVRIRFPGPHFGKMNNVTARLAGNQGTGSSEVEGSRCGLTITFTRISG